MLLDAALHEDARQQLAALEASSFPWLEPNARAAVVRRLRASLLPPEAQEAHYEANWAMLRRVRGLH